MLRENKDVLEVFTKRLPELVEQTEEDLAEPIVHFMFQDLTSPHLHKKLVYMAYQIALCQVSSESWAKFKSKFFKQLIGTLEAKQCGQTMFAQKFERLDTAYLD